MDYANLIEEAFEAAKCSYSPYSNFKVGAAVLTKKGNIYRGCNIENAAFFSSCAERTAINSAIANGEKEFLAIAVCSPTSKDHIYPCGICRQALVEFAPEMYVISTKDKNTYKIIKAKELLPNFFSPQDLKG